MLYDKHFNKIFYGKTFDEHFQSNKMLIKLSIVEKSMKFSMAKNTRKFSIVKYFDQILYNKLSMTFFIKNYKMF